MEVLQELKQKREEILNRFKQVEERRAARLASPARQPTTRTPPARQRVYGRLEPQAGQESPRVALERTLQRLDAKKRLELTQTSSLPALSLLDSTIVVPTPTVGQSILATLPRFDPAAFIAGGGRTVALQMRELPSTVIDNALPTAGAGLSWSAFDDSLFSDDHDDENFDCNPAEVYACLYDFVPEQPEEMAVVVGERVHLLERNDDGWWLVRREGATTDEQEGLVPYNYLVRVTQDNVPTDDSTGEDGETISEGDGGNATDESIKTLIGGLDENQLITVLHELTRHIEKEASTNERLYVDVDTPESTRVQILRNALHGSFDKATNVCRRAVDCAAVVLDLVRHYPPLGSLVPSSFHTSYVMRRFAYDETELKRRLVRGALEFWNIFMGHLVALARTSPQSRAKIVRRLSMVCAGALIPRRVDGTGITISGERRLFDEVDESTAGELFDASMLQRRGTTSRTSGLSSGEATNTTVAAVVGGRAGAGVYAQYESLFHQLLVDRDFELVHALVHACTSRSGHHTLEPGGSGGSGGGGGGHHGRVRAHAVESTAHEKKKEKKTKKTKGHDRSDTRETVALPVSSAALVSEKEDFLPSHLRGVSRSSLATRLSGNGNDDDNTDHDPFSMSLTNTLTYAHPSNLTQPRTHGYARGDPHAVQHEAFVLNVARTGHLSTVELPELLLIAFDAHDRSLELIAEITTHELALTDERRARTSGFLAASTPAAEALELYLCSPAVGYAYLRATVSPFVHAIIEHPRDFFVYPSIVTHRKALRANTARVASLVQQLLNLLQSSLGSLPAPLRVLLQHTHATVLTHAPLATRLALAAVLFRRFLCAALVHPKVHGLTAHVPTEEAMIALTSISTVLQAVGENSPFADESPLSEFNLLISVNSASLDDYFTQCHSTNEMSLFTRIERSNTIERERVKEAVEILETYARANEAVVRVHLSTNKHARDDGAFVPGGRRTLRSIVKMSRFVESCLVHRLSAFDALNSVQKKVFLPARFHVQKAKTRSAVGLFKKAKRVSSFTIRDAETQ